VENTWEWFIVRFESLSQIDLTAYKKTADGKAINSFMRSAGADDYMSFLNLSGMMLLYTISFFGTYHYKRIRVLSQLQPLGYTAKSNPSLIDAAAI
jgi:hypothetical protein